MRLRLAFSVFLLFPYSLNASFIETSIGAAIVEDATATYFNPSALAFIKKKQFIALGPVAYSKSLFNGEFKQIPSTLSLSGSSTITANYFLPALYYTMPLCSKWTLGIALIENDFARDVEGFSILRYSQSNNKIFGLDFVPAIAYKYNKFFSLGAGLYRSRASFVFEPISGFPSLGIPDVQSRNESSGYSWGWDFGLLLKPSKKTRIGFNYRSAQIFPMHGISSFNSNPAIVSKSYRFDYWIPARTMLSISQAVYSKWAVIGSLQYIQWSIFNDLNIYDLASRIGIIPLVTVPHRYHDSWIFTLGSNYRISSKWITRVAGSYLQSPSNGRFQIDNGDTITLGISMAYTLFKNIMLDGSYSHSFIRRRRIEILTDQQVLSGQNRGMVNGFALKLTMNI